MLGRLNTGSQPAGVGGLAERSIQNTARDSREGSQDSGNTITELVPVTFQALGTGMVPDASF